MQIDNVDSAKENYGIQAGEPVVARIQRELNKMCDHLRTIEKCQEAVNNRFRKCSADKVRLATIHDIQWLVHDVWEGLEIEKGTIKKFDAPANAGKNHALY